jgi:hypothetical protein
MTLVGVWGRGPAVYLRKNLIQGARAAPDDEQERHAAGNLAARLAVALLPNTVVVALAPKMARIVWALLCHERTYEPVAQAA